MNILMLGNKDSGKTTYMSSAFGLMEKGVSGFFIKTDTSSREWFHKLFQAISRESIQAQQIKGIAMNLAYITTRRKFWILTGLIIMAG